MICSLRQRPEPCHRILKHKLLDVLAIYQDSELSGHPTMALVFADNTQLQKVLWDDITIDSVDGESAQYELACPPL